MNDPHVERLHYKLRSESTLSFESPPPINRETPAFRIHLEEGKLTVHMFEHYADEEGAQQRVGPYLCAWEIDANLRLGRRTVWFEFERSELIDRNPPPPAGPQTITPKALSVHWRVMPPTIHVGYRSYPPPPSRFLASPDVQTMWFRYNMWVDGREPLLSMAYACLTLLEGSTGATTGSRAAVCTMYSIDPAVRKTLGDMVSERGGPDEARKLGRSATKTPLTRKERQWVDDVIKALIRRKAEYDADPTSPLPLIAMTDFLSLP